MSGLLPSMIFFSNTDIVDQIQGVLTRQLFLDEILPASTFDGYVAADPNYIQSVHSDGYRILVLRNLQDHTNRNLADMVLFIKNGLAAVLINNFGPHGSTFPIDKLSVASLINYNNPKYIARKRCCNPVIFDFVGEENVSCDFNPHHVDHFDVEPIDD